MDFQYVSQSTGLYTTINRSVFLGKGSFGSAYELYDNNRHSTGFVCKTVQIQSIPHLYVQLTKKDSLRNTIDEISTLETMGLLEGYARQDDTFFIVMKKVEGIEPNIHLLNEDSIYSSFNALRDCHRKNITHYDGHSGNFLIDPKTQKTQAIDFGQSRDASFVNIIFDTGLFFLKNNLLNASTDTLSLLLFRLFVSDYVTYVQENKLEAFANLVWWTSLIYGAIYGIPTLMLPNHFFYDYLKSKIFFQAFLELRALALTRWEIVGIFVSRLINPSLAQLLTNNNLINICKFMMKPIYLIALKLPYLQLKECYEANTKLVEKLWAALTKNKVADNAAAVVETVKTAQVSIGYDTNKQLLENFYELLTKEKITSMLTAPTTHTCFQAALLYHPIKAGLTFINDAVINPLQPEFVAKARADLYFQHHPMLYAKAAANTFYNTAAACVNYVNTQKPVFS